ncbi:MAG: type II/IV secretion system ATPase subunit [Nanoarchaeota archaeon]|nr:type II/IV secretion system ATPase subunit [Nanoarchaeota archaeon]MBU0977195.1 type II/IV secretion system ATPase subunit [Nanoarchaeota archaeon]
MVEKINLNPAVPPIPRYRDKRGVDLRYMLIAPYASAHIFWDSKINEIVYELEEPLLTEEERAALIRIEGAMLELINVNVAVENTLEATTSYIDKTARLLIDELNIKITSESYKKIFYYLFRDFIGLNEADPLLRDYFIEDIECNGVNTPVFIVHRVFRNLRTNIVYRDIEKLASFVEKLAQRTGRYVSYAQPLLDGTLPDGSRVNATYTKDVSSRGPTFTIRKFTKIPWTPTQLIAMNTLSPEMLAYFWILIENKANILVAGGTASGKTTLLNALAFFIPPESRVVSIEDTREINLPRENWLPSVARTSIGVGKVGEIDLFEILKASFRQTPDYLIVGEVRGKEAFVLFQGMASGHSSISTMHADSVDTLIRRLQTPPISLSPTLVNTLDCVVVATHARVGKQETRKVREIVEIVNVNADGTALVNTPFKWDASKDIFYSKKQSKIFEKISQRAGMPIDQLYRELIVRAKLLYTLYKRGIFDFDQVGWIVNDFHKNPVGVLQRYNIRE